MLSIRKFILFLLLSNVITGCVTTSTSDKMKLAELKTIKAEVTYSNYRKKLSDSRICNLATSKISPLGILIT